MTDVIRDHFLKQANACEKMGSPFTAELCRLLIDSLPRATATGKTVLDWPGNPVDDALALRLCGGLHALVLDGADDQLAACYPPQAGTDRLADFLPGTIQRHDSRLASGLGNAPQTNEIARSAALYPGLAEISRQTGLPLALHEIGTSAGLNLMMDKFGYRFGDNITGDPASAVELAPEMRGGIPDSSSNVSIASRNGCDVAPLDIAVPADSLRLRSYIWPDQPERLKRLDAAIDIATATQFSLTAADAADYVDAKLSARKRGETFVLYHSVMWQYLPDRTKVRITDSLEKAGNLATADAPIAWLRMEGLGGVEPHATLSLTLWPSGETNHLARCDWHCRWIEWLQ